MGPRSASPSEDVTLYASLPHPLEGESVISSDPRFELRNGGPFGEYDNAIVEKVQTRWYALVRQFHLYTQVGSVEVNFTLRSDGIIKNVSMTRNSAGKIPGLSCEKAIVESAPFDPLPQSLRAVAPSGARNVHFLFYY